MKVIIPYKEKSSRCAEKNLREFSDGKSILDITVEKFQEGGHSVYLACLPSDESKQRAKDLGCEQIEIGVDADAPFSYVVDNIGHTADFSESEPVCVWLATEISFFLNNDIEEFLKRGALMVKNYGQSVVKANPFTHFLVNEKMVGLNFDHGPWFKYSQELSKTFILAFSSVTTLEVMKKYKWVYGPEVSIWKANDPYIDINDEMEFKTCQILWEGWK